MSTNWLSDIADIVMGQSPPGHTCNHSGSGMPLLNGPTEFGPHHPFHTIYHRSAKMGAARRLALLRAWLDYRTPVPQ